MKKKTKTLIIVLISVLVLAVAVGAMYLVTVNQYKQEMANMTYSQIDVSDIPDGTYEGECDVTLIYAKVSVTVKDGQVVDIILLEHDNGKGSAAEGIEKVMVAEQKVDVDDVTGATNSSKVIKKAVDNALASALAVK